MTSAAMMMGMTGRRRMDGMLEGLVAPAAAARRCGGVGRGGRA
jgi:hypothetical protein